jgi:hypothetical protein
MAYDGHPDVQADLQQAQPSQSQDTSVPRSVKKREAVEERIARTNYVTTSTPVAGKQRREVTTLTTEAL